MSTSPVLSVKDLNVRFNTENGVVHAVRGDEHDAWDASYSARRERSCDLLAAENLIDPEDLRRAAAFYPDNLPALAYELDVTEELLVIYLDAHPLTVAQA